jgi:hypothetical protein
MVNNVYRRSFSYNNAYDTNACNLRYKAYTSWYKMPCKCKHAQKESYTYDTKELPHPTQEIKHTPSSLTNEWKFLDLGAWRKYQLAGHVWILGSKRFSLSQQSLRKWYLTYMCLVLEWSIGFFATLITLVLSHRSRTWVYSSPKSLRVYVIQRSWEQQLVATTYSASVVDWATLECLQEDQDTKEEPKD